MAPPNGKPLAVAVGERFRALREARGLRQDDVARIARGVGLRWTRAAVANLEAGRRRLSAVDLLLLPETLNFAGVPPDRDPPPAAVELADLLPEMGWIALTEDTQVQARALRMFLRGELRQVMTTDLDIPMRRHVHARAQERLAQLHRTLEARERIRQTVWPEARDPDLWAASEEATGEAEQKAARKLGVPALAVALEARRRWGRSLSAERDQRVGARTPRPTNRRATQALRGHISRGLLAELTNLADLVAMDVDTGGKIGGSA